MSQNLSKSPLNPGLMIRALVASCILVFISFSAVPRLGTSDVPELPTGDGTGDTPDMFIKLVPNNLGTVVNKGDNLRLSSLRGRVVLLDMFWSQCPHCEEHAPHVVELYNQYRQRGFTVLGLATDRPDKIDDVKAFMRKTKINYPVGFITTEIVAYYADSHNQGVPQMVLFGVDGKMAKRLIGWNPQISQELKQAIDEQIAKLPTVKPGSKASSKSSTRKVKQA
ncbi:MAG: TlpA family protein disulfide reductase [Acidobacteria bacterium]|nr:TlpA family protein disulfide reductase [Acidobacteriota bacterium]